MARRLCKDLSDAEDLVQEVFLRFMSTFKEGPLPDDESCTRWLATTLRNCFISQLRKAKVRAAGNPVAEEPSVDPHEPLDPCPWERVTAKELADAAAMLTDKQREVFDAHAAGKSYKEIAVLLRIPRTSVAKRLHDARLRLRAILLDMIAQCRSQGAVT